MADNFGLKTLMRYLCYFDYFKHKIVHFWTFLTGVAEKKVALLKHKHDVISVSGKGILKIFKNFYLC